LEATCPSCQKKYRQVRKELIGKKAQCTCGHTFRLGENAAGNGSGTVGDFATESVAAAEQGAMADSVDLSSESVFENSYSDLDQILSGHGSTAPLPPTASPDVGVASTPPSGSSQTHAPTKKQTRQEPAPSEGYGSTGMSVGFLAAVLSSCLAGWFSLFVLSSRYSVFQFQPLNQISQTLHDLSRGAFGDLSISVGLERSFVLLSWTIWIGAACLLLMAAGQLINAFAKQFRRRHLLPGIDGITGLTAVLLLFMLLSTIFVHFSHMRQLNHELIQNAGGQIDETTVLGQNLKQLQSNHADHSRQFMTSILIASCLPLGACLLSLSRVYITLGEPDVTPSRRENP